MPYFKDDIRSWPNKDGLAAWITSFSEINWLGIEELISMHNALHKAFGKEPSDAVLEGERKLSKALRVCGIEHRYDDELSKKAGTYIENPVEPTLDEISYYLKQMLIHSSAIKIMQGVEDASQVFVSVNSPLISKETAKTILKTMNRMMPPGIILKPVPNKPKEDFLRELGVYDLVFRATFNNVLVIPWPQLIASAPALIFKEDKLQISVKEIVKTEEIVLKEGEEPERYILGPVLIPDVEDVQGEIVNKAEVRKACHWWAENSGQFAHRHVLQGGTPLYNDEIVMLENYIMPVDCEINGHEIKEGTWMLGAAARDETIWQKAVRGELKAWSIGAETLTCMEEVDA